MKHLRILRYVDEVARTGSIRKAATGVVSTNAADAEYQLTQVRVYEDDLEAAKTATAWWN